MIHDPWWMSRAARAGALGVLVSAGALTVERDAQACGGCFTGESNTVVTDHRMILSVSAQQTTLYDQIRYQGSPESFAWVLPISGDAAVGLSADVVFSALDTISQTQVFAPPRNCPPPPSCDANFSGDARGSGAAAQDAGAAAPGVVVNKQETVGPYETVQLSATNPEALNDWLRTNGYKVPDDVKPVIAKYVTEHFDFLAMKLIPGSTVTSMRPVRVTTRGASPVLPLRMVAAGTGPVVGITLWVLGEGRYAPTNFPSFVITEQDLIWDWTTSSSNYKAVRASKTSESGGRAWEVESSTSVLQDQIRNIVKFGGRFGGPGPGPAPGGEGDYLPVAADGGISQSAEAVREADLTTLFSGIGGTEARLTRLRADLTHAALDADLFVAAPNDQSILATRRQVTREANQPQCPIYQGCNTVGTAPRDEAQRAADKEKAAAATTNGGSVAACATASGARGATLGTRPVLAFAGASALLGVIGLGVRRRRARR